MTSLVPEDGLALNADAIRPPFVWQVSLPDDPSWSVLDTHPATWRRSLDRLVDERLSSVRVRTAQKREIGRFVGDLVTQCQQAGTLLSLVQIGMLPSGEASTAGLHLQWYDSSPDRAELSTVRRAISRQGVVEEHETEAGSVLLQRDHLSVDPFGSGRIGMSSLQAYLPVRDQAWTLIAATATPHDVLVEPLHDMLLHVVGSFELVAAAATAPASDDALHAPASARYEPVDKPTAPGIARGFGTLRPHTVGGDAARPVDRRDDGGA